MKGRRKFCAKRPHEGGGHAVSKINKAASMKITIEDSKRGNIPAKIERLKTVRQEEFMRRKAFDFTLSSKNV